MSFLRREAFSPVILGIFQFRLYDGQQVLVHSMYQLHQQVRRRWDRQVVKVTSASAARSDDVVTKKGLAANNVVGTRARPSRPRRHCSSTYFVQRRRRRFMPAPLLPLYYSKMAFFACQLEWHQFSSPSTWY